MKNGNSIKFINDLKNICKERKVKLLFPNTKSIQIDKNIRSVGYFTENPLTIACSKKSPYFLEILVHESCHMDQYFDDYNFYKKGDDSDLIQEWLLGKDINKIEKHINILRDIELDCEKRAVKKIIKYKLPININSYIQRSNAYIWFHNYMMKNRFWPSPKNLPYSLSNIWKKMPSKFSSDYKKLPHSIEVIFDQNYSSHLNRINL